MSTQSIAQPLDLALRGTTFLDVVFSGVSGLVEQGKEVWAERMDWVPGGIATTAVAATRLGLRVALDTTIGDDAPGALCSSLLRAAHVDLSYVRVSGRTPVTAAIGSAADRAMVTYEDRQTSGPSMRALPASRAVIAQLRDECWWAQSAALVLLDANHDPEDRWDLAELVAKLDGVTVFTPNRAEALAYSRAQSLPEAAHFLRQFVPIVVITDGANGALLVHDEGLVSVPGVPVVAVDTTGAGDVFCVGLMYGMLAQWPLTESVRFAVLCSALSTTTLGGYGAPDWRALSDWLRSAPSDVRAHYQHLANIINTLDASPEPRCSGDERPAHLNDER